jgi:hypothetical protein
MSMQIAEWLRPLDILQLSRVSKYFRSIFTSRTARCVWKVARRNMHNMPDCSDMTEMQYASLMFERQCQVCSVHPSTSRSANLKFGMMNRLVVQKNTRKPIIVLEPDSVLLVLRKSELRAYLLILATLILIISLKNRYTVSQNGKVPAVIFTLLPQSMSGECH